MSMTLEVRCKACGSRMIAHEQGYLVRSMVSEWDRTEHGHLIACGFTGIPQVMFDSDIGDGGFVCMNCNEGDTDIDDPVGPGVTSERVRHGPRVSHPPCDTRERGRRPAAISMPSHPVRWVCALISP